MMRLNGCALRRVRLEVLLATTTAELDFVIGERLWSVVLFGSYQGVIDSGEDFLYHQRQMIPPFRDPDADVEWLGRYFFEDVYVVQGRYGEINLSLGLRSHRDPDGFAYVEKSRVSEWTELSESDPAFEKRAYEILRQEIDLINAYYDGEYYDVLLREVLVCDCCGAEHTQTSGVCELVHIKNRSDIPSTLFQTEIGYTLREWGVTDLKHAVQDGVVKVMLYAPFFERMVEVIDDF